MVNTHFIQTLTQIATPVEVSPCSLCLERRYDSSPNTSTRQFCLERGDKRPDKKASRCPQRDNVADGFMHELTAWGKFWNFKKCLVDDAVAPLPPKGQCRSRLHARAVGMGQVMEFHEVPRRLCCRRTLCPALCSARQTDQMSSHIYISHKSTRLEHYSVDFVNPATHLPACPHSPRHRIELMLASFTTCEVDQ